MTNIKRYIIHKSLFFLSFLAMTACSDDLVGDGAGGVDAGGDFNGEKVMFAVGTTENNVTRAGDAKTYYMSEGSRFVCRMYYKAQTGSEKFDTLGTDKTVWMKVKGSVGNSLYWNKEYTPVPENVKGKGGVDDYGNDYSAPAFYWQNRKEHAFLAWTDLNHATTIVGGNEQGKLKFASDEIYKVYTGNNVTKWVTKYYKIYGVDEEFTTLDKMYEYVQKKNGVTTNGQTPEFKSKQMELETEKGFEWTSGAAMDSYRYSHGWQYKSSDHYATITYDTGDANTATKYDNGWMQHQMFFDKIPFDKNDIPDDAIGVYDERHEVLKAYKDKETGKYICAAEPIKDAEGNYLDENEKITTDPAKFTYNYFRTDEDGNLRYDENTPRYVFYYKIYAEKENTKEVFEYPALAFDMTRTPEMKSMADQVDIVQARTVQAPTGATQEANRVNLYFKHQFSQLQVNVKKAADSSVDLDAEDIVKVELLGVTEKGYVFTELNAEGEVRPTAYEEIDFQKYTEKQLEENQYGTSFQMFEMPEAEYGYLKSFNAIAFGHLQAIRITWKEKETEFEHAASFRIPNTELMNLKSGVRYVWNMEIRRGTLAIIRAEILDWELPDDEEHNGSADGTIHDNF